MEADFSRKGTSTYANMIGKKIESEIFTLVDNPHIIEGLGSRTYDNDGLTTKKRTVV